MNAPRQSSTLARYVETIPDRELARYEHAGFNKFRLIMTWQQCARDLDLGEFLYFMERCVSTGLDPLRKQIYAIKRADRRSPTGFTVAHQTGIDGFRATAASSGAYGGSDPPEFSEPTTAPGTTKEAHEVCRVTVYRIVQGMRVPFTGECRLSEYYPGEANGAMWRQYPHNQLAKCTEAQALRKAFPVELGEFEIAGELGGPNDAEAQFRDAVADRATPRAENVRRLDEGDRDANAAEYQRLYPPAYGEAGAAWPVQPGPRDAAQDNDVPPWETGETVVETSSVDTTTGEITETASVSETVSDVIAQRLADGLCTHPECVEAGTKNKAAAETDPPRCLNHVG